MNEYLTESHAAEIVRQRLRERPQPAGSRRTTRRAVATRLHRLADRLDPTL